MAISTWSGLEAQPVMFFLEDRAHSRRRYPRPVRPHRHFSVVEGEDSPAVLEEVSIIVTLTKARSTCSVALSRCETLTQSEIPPHVDQFISMPLRSKFCGRRTALSWPSTSTTLPSRLADNGFEGSILDYWLRREAAPEQDGMKSSEYRRRAHIPDLPNRGLRDRPSRGAQRHAEHPAPPARAGGNHEHAPPLFDARRLPRGSRPRRCKSGRATTISMPSPPRSSRLASPGLPALSPPGPIQP